jgi:hypothetical protein
MMIQAISTNMVANNMKRPASPVRRLVKRLHKTSAARSEKHSCHSEGLWFVLGFGDRLERLSHRQFEESIGYRRPKALLSMGLMVCQAHDRCRHNVRRIIQAASVPTLPVDMCRRMTGRLQSGAIGIVAHGTDDWLDGH